MSQDIVGVMSIAGAIALMGFSANSVIQGILVAGVTGYTNQLIKQASIAESDANTIE